MSGQTPKGLCIYSENPLPWVCSPEFSETAEGFPAASELASYKTLQPDSRVLCTPHCHFRVLETVRENAFGLRRQQG